MGLDLIIDRVSAALAGSGPARFSVPQPLIDEACAVLGLRLPVRVLVRRYEYGGGRYIGIRDGEHRVGIASDLSARKASRVIWHELTHARQAERLGGFDALLARWDAEMAAAGVSRARAKRAQGQAYRQTPLEREAHANERRYRRRRLTQRRGR